MSKPKITVIIPTRERCDVLEKSIQSVIAQDYDNLDIIVSDNYSSDSTEDVVRATHDRRVKYINTGRRVSMSHNWEFALSHVTDGWVTVIGDDDGLLPASLSKVAEIAKSTDTYAIRSKVCSYSWPSLADQGFGHLSVPLTSGCEVRDSKEWLSKVMNGRANYPELPMLYNGGFIRMSVLNEIKIKTGAFYRSLTPDVYSALSIASAVDSYIYSNEPLAINGASKHSTGTSSYSKEENDEASPMKIFCSEENLPFHEDLPLCGGDIKYPPSIHVLVYESYLQSKELRKEAMAHTRSQQLEIILATSGNHDAEITEWGGVFAKAHGLNYGGIQSKVAKRRFLLTLMNFPRRAVGAINTYNVIGRSDLPIRDVYEASVTAAAIRNVMPSRSKIARQVIARLLDKRDRV